MSLIPVFVFTGGIIFSAPIVLFVVAVIELICYIKGCSESVPKTKLRKHLFCMIVCLALFVIMLVLGFIVLRYV
ncbi:MAG: hypothetical protein IKN90_07145 [Treponema sp.]|nr:hypothetical protein [Treponema sp.]MBR3549838.1 hypothetical protein [Treponema sp.]